MGALQFVLLGALLSVAPVAGSHGQSFPAPKYVPPACQGKPLTVVPRAVALAQTPTQRKTNPAIASDEQLKLFDVVAKIIDNVYVYPDFNGLNWPAIVTEFRARVERGLDTESFYAEMERFVQKLGDQHSHIHMFGIGLPIALVVRRYSR